VLVGLPGGSVDVMVTSSEPACVSTAVVSEPNDLTVPSLKCAIGSGDGKGGPGSPRLGGPNAESVGDAPCSRLRSSDEMLRDAAREYPLPIVRAAEKADGREDAEPVDCDWSCREAGAEPEDRNDIGLKSECVEYSEPCSDAMSGAAYCQKKTGC